MNSTRNMGLAPGVCPLCRHDPCDCATVAPQPQCPGSIPEGCEPIDPWKLGKEPQPQCTGCDDEQTTAEKTRSASGPCPDYRPKPLDLGQFTGYTEGDWVDSGSSIESYHHIRRKKDMKTICTVSPIDDLSSPSEANAHLIAHVTRILDRARELEAEVERYREGWGRAAQDKVAMLEANQNLTTQRDELTGALDELSADWERVINANTPPDTKNKQGICTGLTYARAALARVQGDGDKEGGA